MKKPSYYKEPAFLKDIHKAQISNYQKTRFLNTQQRIDHLANRAHQDLKALGLRTIEFVKR